MSKSVDLREAVAYYKEGHTLVETGDLHNKPLNRGYKKIDPKKLKAYVKEHPDHTQKEMAEAFGCCNQTISKALQRCGMTRKKEHTLQRTKS